MEEQFIEVDYSSIVETLLSMFGEVLCKDAIVSIVESCGGDLQEAANIIMNITTGENGAVNQEQDTLTMEPNKLPETISNTDSGNMQSQECTTGNITLQPRPMGYSQAISKAPSLGAIPKQIPKKPPEIKRESKEMEHILKLHADGIRTLIMMRGASGSGKTHLARSIINKIYNGHVPGYWSSHIFSADDYFLRGGVYCFNKSRLPEAHHWNQKRSFVVMRQGLSPVIIDNTNIESWEMEPYVKEGLLNGYVIVLLEPNTPWAKKIGQLVKKSVHNVPPYAIERMIRNFHDFNSEQLIVSLGLQHHINKTHNIKRSIPEIISMAVSEPNSSSAINSDLQSISVVKPDLQNSTAVKPDQQSSSAVQPDLQSSTAVKPDQQSSTTVKSDQRSSTSVKPDQQNSNAVQSMLLSSEVIKPENLSIIEKQMQNLQYGNNLSIMSLNDHKDTSTNNAVAVITASEATLSMKENLAVYREVEKQLEEASKIEIEWDKGENWDDSLASNRLREMKQKVVEETKHLPQRKIRSEKYSQSEKLLSEMDNVQDWTVFMPTWSEKSTLKAEQSLALPIEKSTTGTSMEIGDTVLSNSKNPFKIITATPRDINEFFINYKSLKIPEKWMLDKGTTTINEVMHTPRCKNEEKHFNEFRKLFKYIPRADLRDIFDKCHGDVNWAVDIVLCDMGQNQSHIPDEESLESDSDNENGENFECDCVSAYDVIPDKNITEEIKLESAPVATTSSPLLVKRKIKKDSNQSDAFSQLKQKIEQNIFISDDHYSKHSLKIRKLRRGEKEEAEEIVNITEHNPESDANKQNLRSTSNIPDNDINEEVVASTSNKPEESDDETISTVDEAEKTISIDVTKDLMSQLEDQFGWKEMVYSSNISTTINVPISILNELNAIWIESLVFQMEENSKQLEIMVKQDEDFARQMAQKEAELLQTTDEPGIPDFKEIMDMDYALSLYHKDVAQWRHNEPNDLAAKLSRDKLKKLFPDVPDDSLSEILMAHDNNFKMTVEALLLSTGKSDVMLAHNGVSKFIMDSENKQREKLLKKEDKELSESEWPSLPENEQINLDVVKNYREEAEKHLKFRNMSHQKAQELMRRGMTPAATFYSEIAAYHKMKYEQSNSYAAASLIHLHAHSGNERDTVDLHFLHVNEAKESLDLFLDEHIQILRNQTELKKQKLFFITGRGLHSNGRPKIKPAVKKRLRERGLHYNETNPGLLSAKVSATSVLANELG